MRAEPRIFITLGTREVRRALSHRTGPRRARSSAARIAELGVTVLLHELRDAVAPAPAARLAGDRERRLANVRQG
jgi:hypothetical protein